MDTDLAVVGAGPGGYVAALRAAQSGLDVTLVERDTAGGVCLNHGCIPSKALLSATGLAHRAGNAERMGVYADPEVHPDEMRAWTDRVVGRLTRGVELLCDRAGVSVVEGTATFRDERSLGVETADGTETLAFGDCVVATGSRPVELPGFPSDSEGVLDARAALALDDVPDRLVVVGGGYVGMELATVYARLGSEVVVLEALEEVLPEFPADLARPVRERAASAGVEFHLGHAAESSEVGDGGPASAAGGGSPGRKPDGVTVTAEGPDGERSVAGDAVLVAVGREPAPDRANVSTLGLDPEGALPTDERMETPVDGVYAVGDVAGDPMLAHAASHEGEVAAAAIAGDDVPERDVPIPAVAFTDPEAATVGARAADLDDPRVGEFPLRANGRALTEDEREGFVRVVADDTGTVRGGAVLGPDASEVVAELGLAVSLGATLADVAETVHAHPTLSEAVREASLDAAGRPLHGP